MTYHDFGTKALMYIPRRIIITAAIVGMAACSPGEMIRVAQVVSTGDTAAMGRMATDKAIGYAANPKALERDIKKFDRHFSALVTAT